MSQCSAFINIVSLEVNSKSRFFMIFYKLFIIINIQNKIKKSPQMTQIRHLRVGAGSRGRTDTGVSPTDFESVTSANSIIPA